MGPQKGPASLARIKAQHRSLCAALMEERMRQGVYGPVEVPCDEHVEEAHRQSNILRLVDLMNAIDEGHETNRDEDMLMISSIRNGDWEKAATLRAETLKAELELESEDELPEKWNRPLPEEQARTDTKPTNPKDIAAVAKVPFSRVPYPVLAETAVALHEGALKYGAANWRTAGVQAGIYIDAVGRHLGAWWEGEDIDPASGLSHITKAIAGLMVLRDGMIAGNWVDDRPQGCDGFIEALNKKMAELNARYPEPEAPHTGIGKERRPYNG